MTLMHFARAGLAAAGLALAPGSAAAQTIDPGPIAGPQPQPITIVSPCSQIAGITPASARPGQDVDIRITPPSGRVFFAGYTVEAVHFANGVAAPFTNVAAHHVRAKVPVGAGTGPIQVTCRSPLTGGTWTIASPTAFTPISFGNTLNPSSATLLVGNSTTVTATLSHPAPAPIALNLTPHRTRCRWAGTGRASPGAVTIPTGAQSASFSVRAHAASGAATVVVSGPNVSSATLTVNVPTPSFSLSVPNNDAEVHWGDSASYSVQVSSHNNFAGAVDLTATGLPFGATAAPVSVNVPAGGSATATFTVATAQAATALGTDSFTLRGQSPNASNQSRTLDVRVLPDAGNFERLNWRELVDSAMGPSRPTSRTQHHVRRPQLPPDAAAHAPPLRLDRGLSRRRRHGDGAGQNAGWPMSIFNFRFDTAIADGPGSRYNLGPAAWNHEHFQESPDGSFVIGVSQTTSTTHTSTTCSACPSGAECTGTPWRRRSRPASWATRCKPARAAPATTGLDAALVRAAARRGHDDRRK